MRTDSDHAPHPARPPHPGCPAAAATATRDRPLAPTGPPGRRTRKARAFTAEIRQLRDQGYTFEAIRAALAAAGVQVSSSTVRREATKGAARVRGGHSGPTAPSALRSLPPPGAVDGAMAPAATAGQPTTSLANPGRGKASAEAFFSRHHSNPLLPPRETST